MRAVGFCVVVLAGVAHASPAAEKLFQDGRKRLQEGKLDEACGLLRQSNDLEERSGTLLNLGDCEEKRGRLATAWEVFVRARALASQKGDGIKAAEAEKRERALAPKLPYLTIRVADPLAGLVLKRNGRDVPAAELGVEVPIDPGHYELEASASGRLAWKHAATAAIGEKAVVEVPALAADPSAPAALVDEGRPPPIAIAPPLRSLTGKHRLGLGAAVGVSSDSDLLVGGRLALQIASVGTGAVRVVPSVFWTRFDDPGDQYHYFDLYALGVGLEYVAPLAPKFFIAGGFGAGVDVLTDSYDNPTQNTVWVAARVSPTLKLFDTVDLGIHLQLVRTSDRTVGLGELGVDYFFY